MKSYVSVLLMATLAATALGFSGHGMPAPATQPNLVFLLVDDLGWADVSWHAPPNGNVNDQALMPNFDTLIKEGIEFDRAYSFSWCGPSRSSFLSGRVPNNVMVNYTDEYFNVDDPEAVGNGIPAGMTAMGTVLKKGGYHTVYNGKWGAGYQGPAQMPLARGFDSYLGYLADSVDHYTMTRPPKAVNTPGGCEEAGFTNPYIVDFWQNEGPANDLNSSGAWLDSMTMDQTIKDIEDHDPDQPLLLIHAFASIHTPLDPPEEMQQKYGDVDDVTRRAYLTMVNFVDESAGRVVDALKKKGMWENTLFVMSSDNGGPTYPGINAQLHGGASNFPLKGSKTSSWEGGIRVASMAAGGLIPPKMRGTVSTEYVHISDWYGTFARLAGVDPFDQKASDNGLPPVDSIDLWPHISGESSAPVRNELLAAPSILYDGQWKLITGADMGNINKAQAQKPDQVPFNYYLNGYGYGVEQQQKYFSNGLHSENIPPQYQAKECAGGCLYDVFADPTETTDVADQYPEVVERMTKRINELNVNLFQPYRGPSTVNVAQCAIQQKAGFYGDSSNVESWVYNKP